MADTTNKKYKSKYHLLIINHAKYSVYKLLIDYNKADKNKPANSLRWYIGKDNAAYYDNGDVCFIYCINLPEHENCILFSGIVEKADTDRYHINKNKYSYDKKGKKHGLLLKDLCIVSTDAYDYFTEDQLKTKYKFSKYNQTSYMEASGQQSLIKDLQKYLVKSNDKNKNELKKYFSDREKCFFDSKTDQMNKHTMYTEEGIKCYHKHHFIPQVTIDSRKIDKELINNSNNLFNLCQNCHKEVHLANTEKAQKMIEEMYNSRRQWLNDTFEKYAKKDLSNMKEWILNLYQNDAKGGGRVRC